LEVRVEGLTVEYSGEPVLVDVTFTLTGPGLVQVLGPNGAGKTTLLRAIAGLVKPVRGRVVIDGVDVTGDPARAGKLLGLVPQRPPVSRTNPITVFELVASRASFSRPWPRVRLRGEEARAAEAALEAAGVPREAWRRRLWELSGGQLMRSFIARALVAEPRVLLMDEPLAPVDPAGKVRLARLIGGLSGDRLVLVTSHDPELLLPWTTTIVLLNRRVVAVGPPEKVLVRSVLERVYGEAVIAVPGHVHIPDEHGGGRQWR